MLSDFFPKKLKQLTFLSAFLPAIGVTILENICHSVGCKMIPYYYFSQWLIGLIFPYVIDYLNLPSMNDLFVSFA